MKLSVLDLSPVPSGSSSAQALRNTIDLARHVDALGFTRYWLAEHHNAAAIACPAPEIMIAEVANSTTRIRVGSGGVMLPNHSPLKVAENFRVLAALHEGRIDLGVGRAAGTDNKTALALRQALELGGTEKFPAQLDELLHFLAYEPEPEKPFGPIKAVPSGVTPPPVFLLASGSEGAALAAKLGLGLAYAHHIGPLGFADAIRGYREAFVPSRQASAPYAVLATGVFCGADDASAEDLARCGALSFARFGQGLRDLPFPSIDEARAYAFDADEQALMAGSRILSGGPERVAKALAALVAEAGADELMLTTSIHDHEERKRSYTRLAEVMLPW